MAADKPAGETRASRAGAAGPAGAGRPYAAVAGPRVGTRDGDSGATLIGACISLPHPLPWPSLLCLWAQGPIVSYQEQYEAASGRLCPALRNISDLKSLNLGGRFTDFSTSH